jgi:hypothetical protein
VDAQDDEGNTPLHFAVSRDAIDGSRALLQYGADSMAANNRRQTPASSVLEAAQAATSVGDTEPAQPAAAFVEPLEATIDAIFDGDGPLGLAFAECAPPPNFAYAAQSPISVEHTGIDARRVLVCCQVRGKRAGRDRERQKRWSGCSKGFEKGDGAGIGAGEAYPELR